MSTSPHSTGFTRYGVLIGAIMVQLILGTVYGYSIFWEPLISEVFPKVVTEAAYAELAPRPGRRPSTRWWPPKRTRPARSRSTRAT